MYRSARRGRSGAHDDENIDNDDDDVDSSDDDNGDGVTSRRSQGAADDVDVEARSRGDAAAVLTTRAKASMQELKAGTLVCE
jgi:hypothetical protein